MKKVLTIFLIFFLFSCSIEEPKEIYETEIKTYVISNKETNLRLYNGKNYFLYFQTPTSTECAKVNESTYNTSEVGDTIKVLIKYWERPPKQPFTNPNNKNF